MGVRVAGQFCGDAEMAEMFEPLHFQPKQNFTRFTAPQNKFLFFKLSSAQTTPPSPHDSQKRVTKHQKHISDCCGYRTQLPAPLAISAKHLRIHPQFQRGCTRRFPGKFHSTKVTRGGSFPSLHATPPELAPIRATASPETAVAIGSPAPVTRAHPPNGRSRERNRDGDSQAYLDEDEHAIPDAGTAVPRRNSPRRAPWPFELDCHRQSQSTISHWRM
jgi:hypothetical protein